MATLAAASSSPTPSLRSRRKSFARRCERYCCNTIIYFPLVFVYGLTSWAVWVQATVGFGPKTYGWTGTASSLLGIALYILLNWSYTTAVFKDPGSPLTQLTSAYSVVPSDTEDPEDADVSSASLTDVPQHTSLTVKSTGEGRYCKKCRTRKPDRAHHCSSCRRCVLKMDHHCPWLATCVGHKNYKPFLLFLIYVTLFCWVCFWVSGTWVLSELFGELQASDHLMPVNYILLAVLAGILGLVLTGFTSWHIYLACTGQTTIESLEKTRYVGPIRRAMHQPDGVGSGHHMYQRNRVGAPTYQDAVDLPEPSLTTQLRNIHANAIPGVTRPEEGIVTPPRSMTPSGHSLSSSPAHNSLRRNLQANEIDRERQRYNSYLDEIASKKLPHAFDHGWRRNLRHLFGESLSHAWLPICNTTGDGWNWEPSQKWLDARKELERERAARWREDQAFQHDRNRILDDRSRTSAKEPYGTSTSGSDDDGDDVPLARRLASRAPPPRGGSRNFAQQTSSGTKALPDPPQNWNDLPEDFLSPERRAMSGPRSKNPPPGDRTGFKEG